MGRPIETIDPLHNTLFDVYDLDGNVIVLTDADGRTTVFEYDPLNQQVEEEWLGSNGAASQDYTTLYSYDYENRLVDVVFENKLGWPTGQIQYTYDFAGRLICTATQSVGGGAFTYSYDVYDGQDLYLQVSDTAGLAASPSSAAITERYLYGPAVDQVLATDNCAGKVLWGLADYEGTIRDVLTASGSEAGGGGHVEFNSFGKPINSTVPLPGFPFGLYGMPYNAATGLYQTETVAYDPLTGQRLSRDPIGFASGTTNLTAYAGNNPVENVDPSGMCYPGLGGMGSAVPPIYLSGPAAEPDTLDTAYDISNTAERKRWQPPNIGKIGGRERDPNNGRGRAHDAISV